MHAAAEWQLRPSRRQQQLTLWLLVALAVFLWLLWPWYLLPGAAGLLWLLLRFRPRVTRLGIDRQGWWLEQGGEKHYVRWRSGSVRRRHVVILNWSVWPWHSLVLRADSFAGGDDFRRLKARLYESWHPG
ncbi:MAG: hypothetical protein KYX62_08400 [Pseudomonadota bacterium]|nr:hypothetical protein [Pseudomonadota bacterium]